MTQSRKKLAAPLLTLVLASSSLLPSLVHADAVDDFINTEMQKRRIPGLQLAVVQHNQIVKSASYGYANLEDDIKVDSETLFSINSITKAFVGVALMQLVEQQRVDLNKPIGSYLPELPQNWQHVTVRQLMSHNSGIPEILKDGIGNLISEQGPEASWQMVQSLPMAFPTASQFTYNQTNYVIIGKLLNKLGGSSFAAQIVDKQLKKLAMTRTIEAGFSNLNQVIKHSARRYTFDHDQQLTHMTTEVYSPLLQTASGMSSTANELANWVIALNRHQLLSQPSLAEMWSATVLNNGSTQGFNRLINGYAIGWPMMVRDEHPAMAAIGGNRAGVFVYPQDDMAIIVLTNLVGALPSQFADDIAGLYIPDMQKQNGFGLPKNIKALWRQLEQVGYAQAIGVAEQLMASQHVKFAEDEVNLWGYSLINQQRPADALEIFKLNTHLFPTSYNTFDSLAEGYWHLGDYQQALQGYQKVLELKPDNHYAQQQIAKLKALLAQPPAQSDNE